MNNNTPNTTEDVLRRILAALEAGPGQEAAKSTPTVAEAILAFCQDLAARGRSVRTVQSYEQRLGDFAAHYGDVPVHLITPAMAHQYLEDLRRQRTRYREHPTKPTTKGGLSRATISGRVQSIRTFFRWCRRQGHIDESPASTVRRPVYSASAESKAMDPEDLRAMLSVARQQARDGRPRDLAILLFLVDTGARAGEVIGLQLEDLDLVGLSAVVEGKTGYGVVDFTEPTAQALSAWLEERPAVDNQNVFVALGSGNYGGPMTPAGLYQVLRRLAKKAGVEGRCNPHSIRHLVGQRFTDLGNLELARIKLRHTDITVTARHYANQDRARLKKATEKLSLVNGESDHA